MTLLTQKSGRRILPFDADAHQALSAAIALGAGFLVSKFIAVRSGADALGYYGALIAAASSVSALASLGIPQTMPRLAHQGETRRTLLSRVGTLLLIAFPLALVASWPLVSNAIDGEYAVPILAAGYVTLSLALLLGLFRPAFLISFSSVGRAALSLAVGAVLGAILSVSLIASLPDSLFPVAIGLSALLGQCGALVIARDGGPNELATSSDSAVQKLQPITIPGILSQSLPVFAGLVVSAVLIALLPLLVLSNAGADTAGLFKAAQMIGNVSAAVFGPVIAMSFYAQAARHAGDNVVLGQLMHESVGRMLNRIALPVFLQTSLSGLLLWALFARDFVPAAPCLVALCLASVLKLGYLYNSYTMLACGLRGQFFVSEVLTGLMLISSVVIAARFGTLTQIGIATLVSQLLGLLLSSFLLNTRDVPSILTTGLTRRGATLIAVMGCGSVGGLILWAGVA